MAGANRDKTKDRLSRKERRRIKGEEDLIKDKINKNRQDHWRLDWFTPEGMQQDIVESFEENTFTTINGPSGVGKTTTALWLALNSIKNKKHDKLIFIKNPTEAGDDRIGYLTGDEDSKLSAHYATTKEIFTMFMNREKLECDLNKRIHLKIPNFILGATFDDAVVIIDEAQTMSKDTVKLILERCGKNTKYLLMGDSNQRYSVTKRNDGFADWIERVTSENYGVRRSRIRSIGYVKLNRFDNQRSEGSALINEIYEDDV